MVTNYFLVSRLNCFYCKVDGKFKRLSPDENEAKELHAALVTKHGVGKPTVAVAVRQYLDWVKINREPTTHAKYKRTLESFAAAHPKLLAQDVQPKHIDSWLNKSSDLGATSKNDRMTTIQGCWSWLERQGVLVSTIRKLNKPTPKKRELHVPFERWEELFNCAGKAIRPMIKFMVYTGTRPQEAIKLRVSNWDRKKKMFVLAPSKAKGKRFGRSIVVPTWMVAEIEQMIAGLEETDFVWQNSKREAWTKSSVNNAFRRLREKMKLPGLCATTLRHSYAADKVSRGLPLEWIAKTLGHTSVAMVYSRYGHLGAHRHKLGEIVDATPPIEPKS